MGNTGRHIYFEELLDDICRWTGRLIRRKFGRRKQMCMKLSKGAFEGPVGDICRHIYVDRDIDFMQKTNV